MNYKFRNSGVCSSMVEFDLNDGIVSNVKYTGGCNGNLKGIAAMAEGMKAEDVIKRLAPDFDFKNSRLATILENQESQQSEPNK